MKIVPEKCTDCARCVYYCPVDAIISQDDHTFIDQETCVECGVCYYSDVCPEGALYQNPLEWPRSVRSAFSDLQSPYKVPTPDGSGGKGTKEEMKTNDVVGRIRGDRARISVEVGRPRAATSFHEVQKVTRALADIGCLFESNFATTYLMTDVTTGTLRPDVLAEKVLYAPVSGTIPFDQLGTLLDQVEELSKEVDTLFVVSLIVRMEADGQQPHLGAHDRRVKELLSKNGKVNLGLGRANPEVIQDDSHAPPTR